MNAGKAISSIIVAASILATGWYFRNRKRSPTGSRAASPSIESVITAAEVFKADDISDAELRGLIGMKPKVELHCHLNGSVRTATLDELLTGESGPSDDGIVHTIEDAFRQFKRVYQAINTEARLRRIVRETLEDAISDNIRYIELRTTPRKLDDVATRKEYVRIVVDEIGRFDRLNKQTPLKSFPAGTIAVRLILTIDRTQSVALAEQTVDIALRHRDIVVGIDFAGNPTIGTFAEFVSVFMRAKGHGLFTTVHTSEIRGVETETQAILDFGPHRVGHFLFPTEGQIQQLKESGIFIEACPTSNICAISGKSPPHGDVNGHHILDRFVRDPRLLLGINTDDPGVFGKSLSDELFAVAKTFKLTRKELDGLILNNAKHAFLSESERKYLVAALSNS